MCSILVPPVSPPVTSFAYISGQAGTGKTFLARTWADADDSAILTATTGIAAINQGGTTINALLRYFDTAALVDAYTAGWLAARLRRLRDTGTTWIILDEVSMLAAPQLTVLVRAMADVNRTRGHDRPEMRLTVVGDFAQLPPVSEAFAFESPEWPTIAAHITSLTTIHRQADREFIEALQAVRTGHAQRAIAFFGPLLRSGPDLAYPGTTVKALNVDVSRFNELKMDALTGREVCFTSRTTGTPRGEWKLIPPAAVFKIGALVTILANHRLTHNVSDFEYVNGDLGILEDVQGTSALIRLHRTGQVVQVTAVTRQHLQPLTAARRTQLRATGLGQMIVQGRWEAIGEVTYTPIRAAWASTVHRAQGLSFDAVQIDVRNRFFRQPGMLYVALSRARTASGLRVVGSPRHFIQACQTHSLVRPWL